MQPHDPPEVVAVDVMAAQPTRADSSLISQLDAQRATPLPGVAYVVRVQLKVQPAATSHGWALYVGDFRVPKYWVYRQGIYFKVFDPRFFDDHAGEPVRFSLDGSEFVDTGLRLGASPFAGSVHPGSSTLLPKQDDLLG